MAVRPLEEYPTRNPAWDVPRVNVAPRANRPSQTLAVNQWQSPFLNPPQQVRPQFYWGVDYRRTPVYQLGAGIARAAIMPGFTNQNDIWLPNQMRSTFTYAQGSHGASFARAINNAGLERDLAFFLTLTHKHDKISG